MSTVLLILGILSLGAVLIAAYVFTVAARNYVSESADIDDTLDDFPKTRIFVERSGFDRRENHNVIEFPLTLSNGEVVYCDRRAGERRAVGC
jgi:hypothetical protein